MKVFLLLYVVTILLLAGVYSQFFRTPKKGDSSGAERCFCQLKGALDDCSCSVETIDGYNNLKIYPRINSLMQKSYFRYWKVDLQRGCPFWHDDSACAMRFCSVQTCTEVSEALKASGLSDIQDVPEGIKGTPPPNNGYTYIQPKNTGDEDKEDCDKQNELGYLNTTLSKETVAGFVRWAAHDDALDNFCHLEDELSSNSTYVDLLLNPERYTGYVGTSAHRIWKTIYQENCFKPKRGTNQYTDLSNIGEMCLEKRAFYRAISGLHSSINIHLAAKYLFSDGTGFSATPVWGANAEEFQKRFDPELTNGEGPHRLKNLYFLYLLELRALAKARSYLTNWNYYTGITDEDQDVQSAVKELLLVIKNFPEHFDETTMFAGGLQAYKLKEEFKHHFFNISRIMDCVGCDKCRLWGKLQVTGLGTALKILFSGNVEYDSSTQQDLDTARHTNFQLTRNEVVALFNAFARLCNSIYELENFRRMTTR
ncbi:endoplasmic reticulum oxidoreductin-1-like protein isoform X2 [Oratosquilla oratoria]|uniref:endoplasmic reticulum oxidoreductin-1-like protein isoform X2 n=1 Tax=Oratosquilla oratoria TaxID=337810 RepID=UPI003F761BE4